MLSQNTDTQLIIAESFNQKNIQQSKEVPQNGQNQKNSSIKQNQQKVKNYLILYNQILGEGSFSQVYKALILKQDKKRYQSQIQPENQYSSQYLKNSQQVAIKIIQKSMITKDFSILIQSEITILKIIKHQNVVKCLQVFQDQKRIFIVTELCNEGDLQKRIDTKGRIQQKQALPIIKDVFQGLKYLDSLNIIHRDLKIANIFMHNGRAKIADFGFAIINSKRKPFQDINIGSPIYMSPQGIKHHTYGPATDVWSFGVMIYQLLHSKTPYSHCRKQKQLKYNISVQVGWNTMNSNLSYGMKQLITKCLQINYQKRVTIQQLSKCNILKPQTCSKTLTYQSPRYLQNFIQKQKPINNQKYAKKKGDIFQKTLQNRLNFNQKHKKPFLKEDKINKKIKNIVLQENQERQRSPYMLSFMKTTTQFNNKPVLKRQKILNNIRLHSKSPQFKRFNLKTQAQNFSFEPQYYKQNPQTINHTYTFLKNNTQAFIINRSNQQSHRLQLKNQISNLLYTDVNLIQKVKSKDISFQPKNINFYLYLIHFSRMCFKISNLHFQLTKDGSVQYFLVNFCLFILESLHNKVQNFLTLHSCTKKQNKQLHQIKDTIQKYLKKYRIYNSFGTYLTFSDVSQKLESNLVKLSNQSEFCINDLTANKIYNKKTQISKRQKVKLQFLILLQGFKQHIKQIKQLFQNKKKRQQSKRYFQDYSIKYLIKNLEKVIQQSQNKNLSLTHFLTTKKN